jgi:PPOX class probable F420-dependent enzyme
MAIDTSTDLWRLASQRFTTDQTIWLTTTSANNTPQPNPVWFIDEGTDLIVFSKPNQAKLNNIQRNPRVALNLNESEHIVILTGEAAIVPFDTVANETKERYVAKYAGGMQSIGMTPNQFAAEYSTVIRVSPDNLRGW